MNTSTFEGVRASNLVVTDTELIVSLEDGRTLTVPIAWYPRLLQATDSQRQNWRWIGRHREAIHWPEIDEDLSVAGFLRGIRGPSINKKSKTVGKRDDD